MLLFFIFIEQTAVYFDKITFDLLVGDVLQTERLDRISKEAARAFEHRIRISFQIDKFSIREHFHQGLHTSRMRRILAQELGPFRIPEGNLDQFEERFLKHFPLVFADIVEKQITVAIFEHMLREEPEIIIRVRHHICQGKFLFLGKIHLQFHIIGRTLVGHQERHVLLEERLSPKHQVREYGLIGRIVAEMLVTREDIVHECRPATPMSENEHRVHLQRLVRNLTVTRIFEGLQQAEQAANGFSQKIFITKSFVDRFIGCHSLERFPVSTH